MISAETLLAQEPLGALSLYGRIALFQELGRKVLRNLVLGYFTIYGADHINNGDHFHFGKVVARANVALTGV